MGTTKTTGQSGTECATLMADLGSEVRFNLNNPYSQHSSFILDETLQLVETPITNPIVHSFSSSLFPDTFEVFHHNLISSKTRNNTLTDIMVYPSHITSFSPTELLQQSLSRKSAFSLQFTTQKSELPFDLLNFSRIIKSAVRSNGEIVYSEINTENKLRSVVSGVDLFGKCKQEESSSFSINSQKTFSRVTPTEVGFVTIRDIDNSFLPAGQGFVDEFIAFQSSTSWEIVADGSSFNNWFGFCFLDNPTSLTNASYCQLGGKFKFYPNVFVNEIMEFDIVPYFISPCDVNAELESFSISGDSSDYLRSSGNFNFCSDDTSHNCEENVEVYKPIGGWYYSKIIGQSILPIII